MMGHNQGPTIDLLKKTVDPIAEGVEAWGRIQKRNRMTREDWRIVGRALFMIWKEAEAEASRLKEKFPDLKKDPDVKNIYDKKVNQTGMAGIHHNDRQGALEWFRNYPMWDQIIDDHFPQLTSPRLVQQAVKAHLSTLEAKRDLEKQLEDDWKPQAFTPVEMPKVTPKVDKPLPERTERVSDEVLEKLQKLKRSAEKKEPNAEVFFDKFAKKAGVTKEEVDAYLPPETLQGSDRDFFVDTKKALLATKSPPEMLRLAVKELERILGEVSRSDMNLEQKATRMAKTIYMAANGEA